MPKIASCFVLTAILVIGFGLTTLTSRPDERPHGRWPTEEALFNIDGWVVDAGAIDLGQDPGTTAVVLQRAYSNSSTGARADLALWSNSQPEGKQLFRKGPDRDYLGAGYSTAPAPADLIPPVPGGGALIASQGATSWLLIYMFGEGRGAVGNGAEAWLFAEFDALLGQPNDYFLARLSVPYTSDEASVAEANELARTLFARLTNWYSRD